MLQQAKEEMKKYRDFFGGEINPELVDQAQSFEDLKKVFDAHESFLEDQLSDAKSHLHNFRCKLRF